jgi:hypothetical protein
LLLPFLSPPFPFFVLILYHIFWLLSSVFSNFF